MGRDETSAARAVLGISCDFHDAAAALVIDGEIVAAAEEERFSRCKHDASLPARATASCLAIAGIEADEVDAVVFYERPFSVVARYVASRQRAGPPLLPGWTRDVPRMLHRNVLIDLRLERMLRSLGRSRPIRTSYVDHHISHAAAAFYPSPFDRAAVVTIDGIGEWATTMIARGHGRRLEPLETLRYPDSLGLLYSYVTAYCGFRPNTDEYKLMGLAPYGTPRFAGVLAELSRPGADGSVRIDARALGWYGRLDAMAGKRAARRLATVLDGPPRRPGGDITERDCDLAASVQALAEEQILAIADRARELTGERSIALAGGVALNCMANGRLRREVGHDRIWVQPAAGDAGSAVGAALAHWHRTLGRPRVRRAPGMDGMGGCFLGPAVHADEVDAWLARSELTAERFADADLLADHVASRLEDGAIVGWFAGRMEFGPRALGHRSILADPRAVDVRQELNRRTKGREDFRPFAPAVLADQAAAWFDLEGESPHMMYTAPVAAEHRFHLDEPVDLVARATARRSTIPACTHVDGSARVQTVDATRNPELHRLLTAFHRRTGCPILLNTSFNRAGEPIVATPDDALATARAAGLDLLVVEHAVIDLGPERVLA